MPATFNEIKDEIARVASGAGLTASDARLKDRVFNIQTRLGNQGGWEGIWEQVEFAIFDRVLTLPLQYEAVSAIAVNDVPLEVMPKWYELMDGGPGPQDDNSWVRKVVRRGSGPVVRQSSDEARYFRVISYADERTDSIPAKVRVLGYDENDDWVRSQDDDLVWQDGIELDLLGHDVTNWDTSAIKFKRITRVVKPVTTGLVEIWWVDNDLADTYYFAGSYDYWVTNPQYKQFVVPSLGTTVSTHSVKALCRRKIPRIVTGDEELLFDNIEAYRLGMIAMAREETKGSLQESAYLWQAAKQALQDEYTSLYGQSNANPRIKVVGDSSSPSGYSIPELM